MCLKRDVRKMMQISQQLPHVRMQPMVLPYRLHTVHAQLPHTESQTCAFAEVLEADVRKVL